MLLVGSSLLLIAAMVLPQKLFSANSTLPLLNPLDVVPPPPRELNRSLPALDAGVHGEDAIVAEEGLMKEQYSPSLSLWKALEVRVRAEIIFGLQCPWFTAE